jgi:hypothetical protein
MPDGRTPIPPPISGTERPTPSLAEGRPRPGDLLLQLGGAGGQQALARTQQAVQLVMSAADALMQAASLDPTIAPVVQDTIRTLQSGLQGLGGGGAGVRPPTRPRRPRRRREPEFGGEEEMATESPEQLTFL